MSNGAISEVVVVTTSREEEDVVWQTTFSASSGGNLLSLIGFWDEGMNMPSPLLIANTIGGGGSGGRSYQNPYWQHGNIANDANKPGPTQSYSPRQTAPFGRNASQSDALYVDTTLPKVNPGIEIKSDFHLLDQLHNHYQFGFKQEFTIDATTLDFSNTSQKELGIQDWIIGDAGYVQFFSLSKITANGLAFGSLRLTKVSENQFAVANDEFDFRYNKNGSFKRNAVTLIGGYLVYRRINGIPSSLKQYNTYFGGSFTINFKGTITIQP